MTKERQEFLRTYARALMSIHEAVPVHAGELLELLDIASRSVSERTLEYLAEALGESDLALHSAMANFEHGCAEDLRLAAEALRKERS